jgi:chromosome segregation ATPase
MEDKWLEEKLAIHDKRLDDHSHRLDKLEQDGVELKTEIRHLVKQLETLNTTMKWFIGLMLGGIVSFFFYAIQNKIL